MARRLPKFPLEMANDAKVRSIEELRENADVKSIVAYFLDGRLKRWCDAWRYDSLSEKLEDVTAELIKNIYDVIEIPVDESEIEAYVKENSTHINGKSVGTDNDEEIVDDEELKKKLKPYVDPDVNLSDYSVDLLPVNSKMTIIRIQHKKDSYRYNYIHDIIPNLPNDDIYSDIALRLWGIHVSMQEKPTRYFPSTFSKIVGIDEK